jgi:hypothetical protein
MKSNVSEPIFDKRILNPIDRISEILFGLIMALTFTCTISVIDTERADVKEMLIGAIGCNIAWGLVDAVMFLLMTITEKGRGLTVFNFVRKTDDVKKAHQFIADALPPTIASLMQPEELEALRKKLVQMPNAPTDNKLAMTDFKMAIGIFILVFLSTFPIAIPFILISDLQTALRTSNIVAIAMMFLCGWHLAKYAGRSRMVMGIVMSLIGVALVLLTIALGG